MHPRPRGHVCAPHTTARATSTGAGLVPPLPNPSTATRAPHRRRELPGAVGTAPHTLAHSFPEPPPQRQFEH
eukprot:5156265-Prymnesium_polylepis.1